VWHGLNEDDGGDVEGYAQQPVGSGDAVAEERRHSGYVRRRVTLRTVITPYVRSGANLCCVANPSDADMLHTRVRPMSTCKDCIDLLLQYVEGELPSDVKGRLELHFSDCQPCEDFLRSYRRTPGLCKQALAAEEIPEGVARKLKGFIHSEIRAQNEKNATQAPTTDASRDVKS
jgi:hypothetical protein